MITRSHHLKAVVRRGDDYERFDVHSQIREDGLVSVRLLRNDAVLVQEVSVPMPELGSVDVPAEPNRCTHDLGLIAERVQELANEEIARSWGDIDE